MRVAVVGSGVSGLCVAYGLSARHEVTVFEADDRVGGHAHTVRVEANGSGLDVDTGFVVFNRRTYPLFSALLDRLGVATQPSEMSFSVSSADGRYEFRGNGLGLWAQPSNIVDPRHASMLYEVLRFNRLARSVAQHGDHSGTLATFLARHQFSARFKDRYLVPLGSAIWSADPTTFDEIPVATFSRFMDNHGMLALKGRPRWRTVTGGSRRYLEALTVPFRRRIRRSCPVHKVVRDADSVTLLTDRGPEVFDVVVLALHSVDALSLLGDPSDDERSVLGSIRYQSSIATLHSDPSVMPRRRRAWASWNFSLSSERRPVPTVSYWMNRLQRLSSADPIFVTLNREDEIAAGRMLGRWEYSHPVLDHQAIAAQRRRFAIQGRRRTWYCGAYWGYGFHEDGVRSARDVCQELGSPW